MALRTTYSEASTPPLTGLALMEEYADRFKTLFDASALPLTTIGGTVDAITATLDPALETAGVFVDGMKFTLTFAGANTGAVTLAINGGTPLSVVDASGTGLIAGALTSGYRGLIEYIGGSFRILGLSAAASAGARYYEAFTASGTWNKPSGLDPDTMVTIEAWGGGGGGGSNASGGAGGGGGYAVRRMRIADLPSSVTVTIGAGGAINARGGNTTFGALLTAYNGGRGNNSSTGGGGGGGGSHAQGTDGSSTSEVAGGRTGGGLGFHDTTSPQFSPDATNIYGGGGGGAGNGTATENSGGNAVHGGAGGAGPGGTAAGVSIHGGNGGASGVAGSAPGGGGGRNAAGARGEVRVWI